MAEAISSLATGRCTIVTGANRGIGFEICRQLAANGVMVVMTARDEKRGVEALQRLRDSSVSGDLVTFHQLDVAEPSSVASLLDFINTRFGRLDIVINNAGINGLVTEGDVLIFHQLLQQDIMSGDHDEKDQLKANGRVIETYELAEECIQINYYGTKRMIEAFLPLLQLSDLPRIVNVSSEMGLLRFLSNEWAVGTLGNVESLTDELMDEVINAFLKDFKEGSLKAKNWPIRFSAYKLSKAALNAYTRIIAKNYPSVCINSACPGYVKTDMTHNLGRLNVGEGAEKIVQLALLPQGEPSGVFFVNQEVSSF